MNTNTTIPEEAEILLATDYIKEIVEGRTEIVEGLEKVATRNNIVLIKSVVCEGLQLAEKPTVKGLHSLGRLISISSKIENYSEEEDKIMLEKNKRGFVTLDLLLAYLIRPGISEKALGYLHEIWAAGLMPYTTDAHLVPALLAVRNGDTFNTKIFARALKVIYVDRESDTIEERLKEWYISKGFTDEMRAKALQDKNQ